MAQDRPTAQELLEAVREFIADDVMPELTDQKHFHARVAVNVLAMVERELALGPGHAAASRRRLQGLLGREGTLAELNADLAARIREGAMDEDAAQVLDHLRRTARDKLTIVNPRYLAAAEKAAKRRN